MALVNNVLVCVFVLVVSVRAESLDLKEGSFSYSPESIAHNEKILRLFIRLASETANHLIRLKREINAHQNSRLNCSEPAIGTKVSGGEKKDWNILGSDLGVKVAKQGQNQPNISAVANGTVTTESSSVQPVIEIANRLMSDGKENKTSTAANGTTVSGSADQLPRKAETQLVPPINRTDGFVAQGGKVGNETGATVARTVVPSSSVGPAPIGQLSNGPTVPSSIAQPQSTPKGQSEAMGNRTLTPPTSVPSSSVGPAPIGQLSHSPTIPSSIAQPQSTPKGQSEAMGNRTLTPPTSVPSSSVGPAPIGQLSHGPTIPSSIAQPQSTPKGQSEAMGNRTVTPPTSVPSSSVGPAPIGQLSHSPTVPSSIAQPQSRPKSQSEAMGNRTLTLATSVPTSTTVRPVTIGQQSSIPTIPGRDSKTPSLLSNQSGRIGNETVGTLDKPSVKNPRDNQLPLGQSATNRTKQLGTKDNITPGGPMSSGFPMNPNHIISVIPNIINGTIGSLMLFGQDKGSQIRAQPNGATSSPSQTTTGRVDTNPKRSSTAGSQVTGAVPLYRSIPNQMNPTTSVPSTVTTNPGSPADANQMISSLEDVNEKMGTMLLVDPNNPGDPNDPKTMILQDPSVQAMGELNYAKHQAIGELIKSVKPMFRSFPDVEDKLPGNNKTSTVIKQVVEKNGTVAQSQSGAAGSNASQNKQLEMELHNYVNKFLDALRPLSSGTTTASKSPAVK